MTYRTYNIELIMTDGMRQYWLGLLTQTKDAFNLCARIATEKHIPLDVKSFHNELYDTIRQTYKLIPAQGAIKVYKEVLSALRSIRRNKHKDANTPERRHCSLHLDKRMYTHLSIDGIRLSTPDKGRREHCGFVMYDKASELFSKYTCADPLIFERNGKLFLSVPFEVNTPPVSGSEATGVDLGVKRLFVTSEGEYYTDKKYLAERRKVRYLKRCLKSKNTRSSKRHLSKVSRRERNLSKDMVERATNALIGSTKSDIIVLEDLKKLKQKTSKTKDGFNRKSHNNMLSQVPFYYFKERLAHKAQLAGKRVETVSPMWTSQTDCRTKKRDGKRQGCRYYCSDGIVLDADWNAAVNIALRANHPLSGRVPMDGALIPISGKAVSVASTPRT